PFVTAVAGADLLIVMFEFELTVTETVPELLSAFGSLAAGPATTEALTVCDPALLPCSVSVSVALLELATVPNCQTCEFASKTPLDVPLPVIVKPAGTTNGTLALSSEGPRLLSVAVSVNEFPIITLPELSEKAVNAKSETAAVCCGTLANW